MTQISANHPLVGRIAALRQRARMLLAIYGIGYVAMTLLAGVLALVITDYFVHFDRPVSRVILLITLLVVVALVAWRKLIIPLSTRMSDQFLASRVEMVNKNLADELMSALQFIRDDTGKGSILAAKVVEGAIKRAEGVKFEGALEFKATSRAVLGGGSVLVAIVVLALLGGQYTNVAFARWGNPFNTTPWPHMQTVSFDWSGFPLGVKPEKWMQGEAFPVTVKVDGYSQGMIASIYFSSDTVHETRDLMTPQEGKSKGTVGVFQKDMAATGENTMHLRVVAGDHSVETDIILAARPVITVLKATITPPAYVKGDAAASRNYDLMQEPARAVEGSIVHLIVKSSKPIFAPGGVPAVKLMRGDRTEALLVDYTSKTLPDPFTADLAFAVNKSMEFRMEMRDTDGFENQATGTVRIDAVADAMPSVIITEPKREIEIVPDGQLSFKIGMSDDLGLSELWLRAENFDSKKTDEARLMRLIPIDNQVADGAARAVVGTTTYILNLADLKVKPGERLSICAMVRDNYEMPGDVKSDNADMFEKINPTDTTLHHKMVRSASVTVVIKSREQIAKEMGQQLDHAGAEIQQVHDLQRTNREKTEVLRKSMQASGVPTQDQQMQLAKLTTEEAGLTQRSSAIQQKIEQIRDTLKANKMDQDPIGQLAEKASGVMKDVSQQDMPKATSNLQKAQQAAQGAQENQKKDDQKSKDQSGQQSEQAQQAAQASAGQQQQAENKLGQLAKEIADKGRLAQFQQAVTDLKARTDKNEQQTKDLGQKTQGKEAKDLTADEKAQQAKITQEQKDLAQQQRDLEKELQDAAKEMQKTNPSASQAVAQAAETSQQQQVAQKQDQAAQAAQQNQTNQAQQQQQQASQGLAKMQQNLNDAAKYEKERIAAETAKLLEEVKKIRDTQQATKDATEKAGENAAKAALLPLGDRENQMNLTMTGLRDRTEALPDSQTIANDLKDAQTGMQDATGSLYHVQQPPAMKQQTDTLVALDEAIKKLQVAKDKQDAQAAVDDLQKIREEFEKALKAETDLRSKTRAVAKRTEARGDLAATDQKALGDMSADQGKLADNVHTLTTGKLADFEEYVWITNQVVDMMGTSRSGLAKAQTGRDVASAQDSAITRLSSIIDALKEEQQEKEKFLKDQPPGGGGAGKPPPKPLIPPLAELKMLRRMQGIENAETLDKSNALKTAVSDADKSEVRDQVKALGEEQKKVGELAQKVMEKLSK